MTAPQEQERFRRLEVAARRTLSRARHPDACPKLTLHGVPFAVPPRGGRVVPVFRDGALTAVRHEPDRWPEADRLLALLPAGGGRDAAGETDLPADAAFLRAAFGLAAKLLGAQYDLTDAHLGALLSFTPDGAPDWLGQLVRWCRGLATAECNVSEQEIPTEPTPPEAAAPIPAPIGPAAAGEDAETRRAGPPGARDAAGYTRGALGGPIWDAGGLGAAPDAGTDNAHTPLHRTTGAQP